jgi:hypothetical protein
MGIGQIFLISACSEHGGGLSYNVSICRWRKVERSAGSASGSRCSPSGCQVLLCLHRLCQSHDWELDEQLRPCQVSTAVTGGTATNYCPNHGYRREAVNALACLLLMLCVDAATQLSRTSEVASDVWWSELRGLRLYHTKSPPPELLLYSLYTYRNRSRPLSRPLSSFYPASALHRLQSSTTTQ